MPSIQESNLVGARQDLSDVLAIANAADMPFMTMIKKGARPTNTLIEYPIDKYDNPRVVGVPDGKDADSFDDTQRNRALLRARVMKQRRNPMVTEFAQDITEQAGDDHNKMNQAKAKSTIELKQDWEATLLGDQDSSPAQSATIGPVTRGMGSWTQVGDHADTACEVPAAFRPVAAQIYTGAIGSFTEDALRAMLQARYEVVKAAGDLKGFVGTLVKNQVSDFSRYDTVSGSKVEVRRYDASQPSITINTSVDIYKGDYGTVELFLDLFVANMRTGHFVDMNMVELRPAKLPQYKDLPDLDGGPRGVVKAIMALANKNPQSHCKVAATP